MGGIPKWLYDKIRLDYSTYLTGNASRMYSEISGVGSKKEERLEDLADEINFGGNLGKLD